MKALHAWLRSTEGATAVEYGFIAGGVALAILLAVLLAGGDLLSIFNSMNDSIDTAVSEL